jgi:TonB-dependent SusC/RagA subfamily outer membrane receptor
MPHAARPAPQDDVVAVGYGTQSRSRITGAVSSYTPTEADARVARVETMLQGRIPGLQVVPLANGGFTLRIRGFGSLQRRGVDDEPLLVIDDIPVMSGAIGSALAGIAPRDVARIDVLKDAGSASVYGSRGANGVVIITTKRAP